MDAVEAPSHHSPSANAAASIISPQRHFYLAVDRIQFKMETLVDLLGMAGRRPWLPMVVCCSTRDELDAVCSAVSNISCISVTPLYSDLAEAERALVLDKFRHATMKWNRNAVVESGTEKEEQKSHMIVATDTCLPLLVSGESPISSSVLINYELPTKKETYTRRMTTCLAADGIVINMVVGGEVVTLKSIEESSGIVIAEMPINIFEMF
ncbi:ATP-dependent RNA helicase eIF4A [Rutidosis leptorrhynchoides]|uniref:ATP-dependent RNA helicase eIF4A n=1 Tax=Rutidosis leptorrhynchoides TaxID=125765 RepID=UPI003A998561